MTSKEDKYEKRIDSDRKGDKKSLIGDSYKDSEIKKSSEKNGMICPKSVRLRKNENERVKDKLSESKDKPNLKKPKDSDSKYLIKKSISEITDENKFKIQKIDESSFEVPSSQIKQTKTKPILLFSYNINDTQKNYSDDKDKSRKKKKRHRSASSNSNDESKNHKKSKKHKKVKKKKDEEGEKKEEKVQDDSKNNDKNIKSEKASPKTMSLLVSYSDDDDDETKVKDEKIVNNFIKESTPEIKSESKHTDDKKEDNKEDGLINLRPKIEMKLKPTKSPGKSAWDSSDSEMDTESSHKKPKLRSRSNSNASKHTEILKTSDRSKKSVSRIHTKSSSHSRSRHRSQSHSSSSRSKSRSYSSTSRSYSKSYSKSDSDYSRSHSKSYSRSRSKRKSRRHRHRRSRSRSRHRHRKSYSSYTSSSSRSSYSSYSSGTSRSRSRSSKSRSGSYSRGRYYRKKRHSSDRSLKRKVSSKTVNRSSTLLSNIPKQIEINRNISQRIDAIKEASKKASSLNIPLPPEKPKNNNAKPGPGEWCPSMDFGGPAPKKPKKNNNTNISNVKQEKSIEQSVSIPLPETTTATTTQSTYIGPQVSVDMAKKLGLDVKHAKKEEAKTLSEEYSTLDSQQIALQNLAIQHRMQQGMKTSQENVTSAQYFQPYYVTPSISALAGSEHLTVPTSSVAVSAAQAAVVQRLISAGAVHTPSSVVTAATSSTPMLAASVAPTSLQTALQQQSVGQNQGTFLANTSAGLVPVSLLHGGMQINPYILQQLQQQQALSAHFNQSGSVSVPTQALYSGVNPLILQQAVASNQHAALLQSLGVGSQAQLLSPSVASWHQQLVAAAAAQHQAATAQQQQQAALVAAVQQQQQQQVAAAHQQQQQQMLAAIQAAQLQAQIQAQARLAGLQNLQQAAQMQSLALAAASSAVPVSSSNGGTTTTGTSSTVTSTPNSIATSVNDSITNQIISTQNSSQAPINSVNTNTVNNMPGLSSLPNNGEAPSMVSNQNMNINPQENPTDASVTQTDSNKSNSTSIANPITPTNQFTNVVNSNIVKQSPRILYNTPHTQLYSHIPSTSK